MMTIWVPKTQILKSIIRTLRHYLQLKKILMTKTKFLIQQVLDLLIKMNSGQRTIS